MELWERKMIMKHFGTFFVLHFFLSFLPLLISLFSLFFPVSFFDSFLSLVSFPSGVGTYTQLSHLFFTFVCFLLSKRYFKAAADQGHGASQFYVGSMYAEGRGMSVNQKE